jgi:hypothetical protein
MATTAGDRNLASKEGYIVQEQSKHCGLLKHACERVQKSHYQASLDAKLSEKELFIKAGAPKSSP